MAIFAKLYSYMKTNIASNSINIVKRYFVNPKLSGLIVIPSLLLLLLFKVISLSLIQEAHFWEKLSGDL